MGLRLGTGIQKLGALCQPWPFLRLPGLSSTSGVLYLFSIFLNKVLPPGTWGVVCRSCCRDLQAPQKRAVSPHSSLTPTPDPCLFAVWICLDVSCKWNQILWWFLSLPSLSSTVLRFTHVMVHVRAGLHSFSELNSIPVLTDHILFMHLLLTSGQFPSSG